MKIQYCSDLHLEFPENKNFLKQKPVLPVGEILILAGDIVPFSLMDKHKDFFNYVSDNFKTTYWIPGNHEYYYYDAAKKCGVLNEKIRSNVFLVNNTTVEHENIRFIFSTLWSKISPAYEWDIERNVSDFQVIKFNKYRFSAMQFNQLHEESFAFIASELKRNKGNKTVLATHHVPTFLNYPEMYKGSALNGAFAVELFDLIDTTGPDFWIFGHHHFNVPDFTIGRTKMLTNQLGYIIQNEQRGYNDGKYIEII